MHVVEYPYKECEDCENIFDCNHPDISTDFMGHPVPPPECPFPLKIALTKKNKKKDDISKNI
jgi:hypothetical protein